MENNLNIKILIAGEGGQGVQTVAKILARAIFEQKMYSLYVPNFGVEQRGGVSIAFLQISDNFIPYPKFAKADVAIVLSQRAVERIKSYISTDSMVIYNNTLIKKLNWKMAKKIGIDATNIAISEFSYQSLNMIILGSVAQCLKKWYDLKIPNLNEIICKQLCLKIEKNSALKNLNLNAVKRGKDLIDSL